MAILALFAGVLTVVNAQDTIDNLKDAVSLAIENHPQVMKGKAERDSTIELRQEAKSGYLPTLELRSAGGYENSQTESIENEGEAKSILVFLNSMCDHVVEDSKILIQKNNIPVFVLTSQLHKNK